MSISSPLRYTSENPELSDACVLLQSIFSTPGLDGQLDPKQIKRAARQTVDLIGHEWVLQMKRERDEAVRTFLVLHELKRIVKRSLVPWHKDPARVWRVFKKHALEIAASNEAKKLLSTF